MLAAALRNSLLLSATCCSVPRRTANALVACSSSTRACKRVASAYAHLGKRWCGRHRILLLLLLLLVLLLLLLGATAALLWINLGLPLAPNGRMLGFALTTLAPNSRMLVSRIGLLPAPNSWLLSFATAPLAPK